MKIKSIILLALVATVSLINSGFVFAIQQSALNSVANNRSYYNPVELTCEPGANGEDGEIQAGEPANNLKEFVDKYGQFAYENSIKSGVPYDFTLAQAIIEGGYDSVLAAKYNNLFGIKAGSSWTGPTVSLPTREVINGEDVVQMAEWRVYATPEESFSDHDKFLRENPRYANAFNYSNDSMQFLREVKAAGYATDPKYVSIVGSVIKQIQSYVAEKNLFPPVSEIKYEITAAPPAGTTGSTASNANGSCQNSSVGLSGVACPEGSLESLQVGNTTYYKLPEAKNGEYDIYAQEKRRFGHKELVCAIYSVAKAYHFKYEGRSQVSVGDLNASGHQSHKWGVAVDIDAPAVSGSEDPLYAADHTKGNYSKEATIDFGKLWVDTGILKNIWWCPPGGDDSIEQIKAYAKSTNKPLNSIKCISGHDNHFHVDINTERGATHTP